MRRRLLIIPIPSSGRRRENLRKLNKLKKIEIVSNPNFQSDVRRRRLLVILTPSSGRRKKNLRK